MSSPPAAKLAMVRSHALRMHCWMHGDTAHCSFACYDLLRQLNRKTGTAVPPHAANSDEKQKTIMQTTSSWRARAAATMCLGLDDEGDVEVMDSTLTLHTAALVRV